MADKKILLLGRSDTRPDYDTAESMAASLRRAGSGIVYDTCHLHEVVFTYDGKNLKAVNGRDGQDLASYDGIFMFGWFKRRRHEDIALAVALYAEHKGVKVLNGEALRNRSRSKLSQQVIAVLNGVNVGPFVITIDKAAAVTYASALTFPVVAKSASGSRGRDNYLVNTAEELREVLSGAPPRIFVVQPFIPNDGDYRLLVMEGEVRLVIHRQSQGGSHLHNTSQGGKAEIVAADSLPEALRRDAVTMAMALHREISGVDMIINSATGEHYFLEANNMPQLSTGSFVAEKAAALHESLKEWLQDTKALKTE